MPDEPTRQPRPDLRSPYDTGVGTAALSLVELRRHLIRRAGTLNVRARALRIRGDIYSAARLEEQAARLWRIAKEMRQDSSPGGKTGS